MRKQQGKRNLSKLRENAAEHPVANYRLGWGVIDGIIKSVKPNISKAFKTIRGKFCTSIT